ncbi:lysophospholipid acyltransferase family protein [Legionella tunisiensis]|uniref:lysophospholipid acyltransferase family protein n=1 Tax=Legionella tunisiensis TaxID=1034944 RepID=UPI000305DA05|nr:lysophospholipid acyltransferase family protein [Legionella tunisiensis]
MFQRYRSAGLHVIDKKGALRRARGALAANDAVLFAMDQHAATHNKQGIAVEFFGRKAGTYRSLAALAQRTGAPVVPLVCYRLASGQHVIAFYPQVEWTQSATKEEAIYHNTRNYNQVLEKLILTHPEQWLWSHRRWKLSEEDC